MSSYNGSFRIVNYSGRKITRAHVLHARFGTAAATQTATDLSESTAAVRQSSRSSVGEVDARAVLCALTDGIRYAHVDKQCDYDDSGKAEPMIAPNKFTPPAPQSDGRLSTYYDTN